MTIPPISPVVAGAVPNIVATTAPSSAVADMGGSFVDALEGGIDKLEASMNTADQMVAKLAAGEPVELHEVMAALETESIGLQTALQVRNKALDAYKEIMAMPI